MSAEEENARGESSLTAPEAVEERKADVPKVESAEKSDKRKKKAKASPAMEAGEGANQSAELNLEGTESPFSKKTTQADDENQGSPKKAKKEKPPPPPPPTEDSQLYVHFIPGKEAFEAGTPWIVHSRGGCFRVGRVEFESVAGMSTDEKAPKIGSAEAVCKCGVSNHHLAVQGVVRVEKKTIPEFGDRQVAIIRSVKDEDGETNCNPKVFRERIAEMKKDLAKSGNTIFNLNSKAERLNAMVTKLQKTADEHKQIAAQAQKELKGLQREMERTAYMSQGRNQDMDAMHDSLKQLRRGQAAAVERADQLELKLASEKEQRLKLKRRLEQVQQHHKNQENGYLKRTRELEDQLQEHLGSDLTFQSETLEGGSHEQEARAEGGVSVSSPGRNLESTGEEDSPLESGSREESTSAGLLEDALEDGTHDRNRPSSQRSGQNGLSSIYIDESSWDINPISRKAHQEEKAWPRSGSRPSSCRKPSPALQLLDDAFPGAESAPGGKSSSTGPPAAGQVHEMYEDGSSATWTYSSSLSAMSQNNDSSPMDRLSEPGGAKAALGWPLPPQGPSTNSEYSQRKLPPTRVKFGQDRMNTVGIVGLSVRSKQATSRVVQHSFVMGDENMVSAHSPLMINGIKTSGFRKGSAQAVPPTVGSLHTLPVMHASSLSIHQPGGGGGAVGGSSPFTQHLLKKQLNKLNQIKNRT